MGCELALVNAAADVDSLTEALGRRFDLARVIKAGTFAAGIVVGLVIAYMTACATVIDEHQAPPVGWPKLMVRDNVVSGYEVIRRCYQYQTPFMKAIGSIPMACAEIRFDLGTCDIWRAHDASEEIMKHEYAHCLGHSHQGETWAQDALNAYRGR